MFALNCRVQLGDLLEDCLLKIVKHLLAGKSDFFLGRLHNRYRTIALRTERIFSKSEEWSGAYRARFLQHCCARSKKICHSLYFCAHPAIACTREGFWAGPIKCVKQRFGDAGRQGLSKAKRKEEYEERTKQAMSVLNEVSNDTTTPRNIRRAAKTAMDSLQTPGVSLGVRAANAISILDDISQDPNMPPYTRVKLWNAVSVLEAIKD